MLEVYPWAPVLPDVEVGEESSFFGLVSTPDVIAFALVGHQLPVGLHHDGVEVLDAVRLKWGKY